MPKFDAGAHYSALDYDFTAAGVEDKGTVPEPTDDLIGKFLSGLKSLINKVQEAAHLGEVDTSDPIAMLNALNSLDPETFVSALTEMAEHYAALTRGKPSKETILKLPLRVRQAFYEWIQTEVINPESAPGGSSDREKTSAAAGSSSTA